MFSVHQAPALAQASVHAHIHCVIHLVELLNGKAVMRGEVGARKDELTSRVVLFITRNALEQRNQLPSHVLFAHIEPQASIGLVLCKLDEALDGQVDTLTRLVPVAIEYNEYILGHANIPPALLLVHGEELGEVRTMAHNANRAFVAHLLNFALGKLRICDELVPFVQGGK